MEPKLADDVRKRLEAGEIVYCVLNIGYISPKSLFVALFYTKHTKTEFFHFLEGGKFYVLITSTCGIEGGIFIYG